MAGVASAPLYKPLAVVRFYGYIVLKGGYSGKMVGSSCCMLALVGAIWLLKTASAKQATHT